MLSFAFPFAAVLAVIELDWMRRACVRKQKKKLWVQGLMGDDLFWDKTAQLVNSGSGELGTLAV